MQFKVLLLPAGVPLLATVMIGRASAISAMGWGGFGLWASFVIWRYWLYMREVLARGTKARDRESSRAGK
jgi:hypothetical protein